MALPEGTLRDLDILVKQHHIIETLCPCNDIFTMAVILGEAKQFDQHSLLVECKSVPYGINGMWPSFLPNGSQVACPHERTNVFNLAMHQHHWNGKVTTGSKVLLYNVINKPWAHEHFVESRGRNAGIFALAEPEQNDVTLCGELCTGAFSGWSHAVKAMAHLGHRIKHSWGIEIDPICCETVSKTHGFHRVSNDKDIKDIDFLDESTLPPLFQMDIRENWVYHSVLQHTTDALLMSPPCQPWTSAVDNAKGLLRRDGMTMMWCWAKAKIVSPKFVLMEMVSGITKHPHWTLVKQVIQWAGFEIRWIQTLQLAEVSPHSRNRLLLVAVRNDLNFEIRPWISWPKIAHHTLRTFGCILHDVERFGENPFLSQELLQIYMNTKLAPKDMSDRHGKAVTKDRMRKLRLKSLDDTTFPCILANYTKAHHLPIEVLVKNGLFGGLFMQDGRPRFLTSPEIFVLMGGITPSYMPACKEARIHTLGNGIAVQHAVITLLNLMNINSEKQDHFDVHEHFAQIMSLRMKNNNMRIRISNEGLYIDNLAFDQPSISPTIPIKSFVQFVVQSPTETFKFWLESNLPILPALSLLVGPSMPSKVEVVIHDHFCMVVEEKDTAETCGQFLKIGVPCILHIEDDKINRSNTNMVVVLTPMGPIIINKSNQMTMHDINRSMIEFFPELPKIYGHEIITTNPFGFREPDEKQCGDMIHFSVPLQNDQLNEFFLQDLELLSEMGSMHITMQQNRLDHVISHFSRLGIDKALLTMGWMMVVGQEMKINETSPKLLFVRQPGFLAADTNAVRMMIASKLMLAMLHPPCDQNQKTIFLHVKLWNFLIWEGWYHEESTIEDFTRVWDRVCRFIQMDCPLRAVFHGRNASIDQPLRIFRSIDNEHQNDVLKIHLITGLKGGGNKADEIIEAKNAIAVFLLSKGAELQQTSHFADAATRSAGVVAVQRIMSINNDEEKMNAMQQLAKSLHIKWPSFPKHENETNNLVKQAVAKKNLGTKRIIKADSFKLISDNIINEDGSVCSIRQDIAPNTAGVALLDKEVACQWLEDFKIISQDELAILVLGHGCPSKDRSHCTPVQVSALGINGHPAVLQCCLHNLGAKKVKIKSEAGDQVKIASSSIIAITVFRDEISMSDWKACIDHPVRFALETLGIDDDAAMVSPPWGRSWINQKGKCEPQNAMSFQCHTRIPLNKLEIWMRKSGNNGVFIVPKGEDHQLDTRYLVIWLEQNSIELAKTAVDHPDHLGIVRNSKPKGDNVRTMRGIRFKHQDFEVAWKALKPGEDCPEMIPIKWLYKISPIPVAATHTDIKEWLKGQLWKAKPIKALGSNMWLIGSTEQQDQSFMNWNGHSILVKEVNQQKNVKSSPVVAGHIPRQNQTSQNIFKSGDPHDDPWARYAPVSFPQQSNAPSASSIRSGNQQVRQIEAPIEQRFKAQDAKIDELSNQITQMQKRNETKEKHDEDFKNQVTKEFATVRSEVDRHIQKMSHSFEQSLDRAMAKQDRSLGNSIQELKLLLQDKANPLKKAKATPPDEKPDENL